MVCLLYFDVLGNGIFKSGETWDMTHANSLFLCRFAVLTCFGKHDMLVILIKRKQYTYDTYCVPTFSTN